MRRLPPPAREAVRDHLVAALQQYQHKGVQHGYPVTTAELDEIVALYDAYDQTEGAPAENLKGTHLNMLLRTCIKQAYGLTHTGRRLVSIRTLLMSGVERCPICGISAPQTLDHHLPQSTYNPLSIYVRNLVPLCKDCNEFKNAAAPAEAAQRFIHPYFEWIPDQRFLRAEVTIAEGGLVAAFSLDPAVEMPALLSARLNYQLSKLRLNARYAREINAYLSGHTTAFHWCFEALGADGMRRYLQQQASVEFEQFHANYWRPVLLLSLAAHDGFCAGGFIGVLPPAAGTGPQLAAQ